MNSYVTTPTPNANLTIGSYISSTTPGTANSYVSGFVAAATAGRYVTLPLRVEEVVLAA